jgi:hypothetical protein
MTVSGLGSARSPRPSTTMPARPGRVHKAAPAGSDFDRLTSADRELILQVTGQRIGPGFDPAREPATGFAAVIAADRAAGRLMPGQEVTAVYLKDVHQRYERTGGDSPVGPYLDQAVSYLARSGARRIDVTA